MKILVTGGAGYLGSVLVPKLLLRGHAVRVVDIGYFGMGHLQGMRPQPELIRMDLRSAIADAGVAGKLLEGVECVLHLAALSNDPSAELQPELTEQTNLDATIALAEEARRRRIPFLFSSTCSVYGEAVGPLDEEGATNPLTIYAISKLRAERALESMADASWRPVILRNGTLFGYSPRMRFDLVVNIFSMTGTLYNEVRVFGEGQQWRPFLHVGDCARAFVFLAEKGSGCRFLRYNIAHQNLTVMDLARIFQELRPMLKVTKVPVADTDSRNYSVSTDRLRQEGFETRVDVGAGAEEIMEAIVSGTIPDPESLFYRNAKWLKELTNLGSSDHSHIVDMMETFNTMRRNR